MTRIHTLSALESLTELRFLQLSDTYVTDAAPLRNLVNLEELYLHRTAVSDISALAELSSLKFLGLSQTPVREVTPLAKLTQLQWLDLRETLAADDDIARLERALPNCNIERGPRARVPSGKSVFR